MMPGKCLSGSCRSIRCSVPQVARSTPGAKTVYAMRRPLRLGQSRKLVGHIKITRGTSSGWNAAMVNAVRAPTEIPTTVTSLKPSRRHRLASRMANSGAEGPAPRDVRPYPGREATRIDWPAARKDSSPNRQRADMCPPCKINTAAPPRRSMRYSIGWPSMAVALVAGRWLMDQILPTGLRSRRGRVKPQSVILGGIVSAWICRTCAVEQPDTDKPPASCAICSDERQYVRPTGQQWTTLAELAAAGRGGTVAEVEPGLYGITIEPSVGIGQRALLVRTGSGNLLWDPTGYVDDDLVAAIEEVGGVAAVAASHPHMFGVQVEWSHRFGGVPVYLQAADREWLQRDDPVVTIWDEKTEVLPGVALHRIGGHFPGSAVAHFVAADGRGVLLSGDTVAGTPDEHWVSFMRSFPNKNPLSAAVVAKVADRVMALDFDRLYDNFGGQVIGDAAEWVRRSADRYIGWVRGDFDHLTG